MLVKNLENIKTVLKIADIDLSKSAQKSRFIKIGKDLEAGYSAKEFGDGDARDEIYCLFSLYDKVFVMAIGELVLMENGEPVTISEYDGVSAFEFHDGYENCAFIISSQKCAVVGVDSLSFNEFDSPGACFAGVSFDNRAFLCDHNTIYFSKQGDCTNFTVGNNLGGSVKISEKYGKIVGIKVLGEGLYILCQHGILRLNSSQTCAGYNFERLELEDLDVKQSTLALVNKKLFFINNERICSFDGKNLEIIDSILDKYKCNLAIESGEVENKYFVNGIFDGDQERKVYLINPNTKEECFLENILAISEKGGLAVRSDIPNTVCRICENDDLKHFYFKSEKLDLGEPGKKVITEIRVNTKSPIRITMQGDFGECIFDFDKGYVKKRCNLISDEFSLEIKAHKKAFSVKDLSFEYYVKGE